MPAARVLTQSALAPLILAVCLLMAGLPAARSAGAQALPLAVPAEEATRRISVVVTPGLRHTTDLADPALRAARKEMLAGRPVSDAALRALADNQDGLAALKYVRRLMLQQPSASASDIAYYGSIAVSTGRVWPLADTLAAMRRLDPASEPKERLKLYLAMLYPHAWAGNTLALDAVIDLNGEGRLFGAMSQSTRERLLEHGRAAGDGRILLGLALNLLAQSERSPAEEALLAGYLAEAAAVDNLAIRTTAANLMTLAQGKTGKAVVSQ